MQHLCSSVQVPVGDVEYGQLHIAKGLLNLPLDLTSVHLREDLPDSLNPLLHRRSISLTTESLEDLSELSHVVVASISVLEVEIDVNLRNPAKQALDGVPKAELVVVVLLVGRNDSSPPVSLAVSVSRIRSQPSIHIVILVLERHEVLIWLRIVEPNIASADGTVLDAILNELDATELVEAVAAAW